MWDGGTGLVRPARHETSKKTTLGDINEKRYKAYYNLNLRFYRTGRIVDWEDTLGK